MRVYRPVWDARQEAVFEVIRDRVLAVRRATPWAKMTRLQRDRDDLLVLLAVVRGELERQRWALDHDDATPTLTPN